MIGDEFLREGLTADVAQMDAVIGQFLDYARLDENERSELSNSQSNDTAVPTDVVSLVNSVAQRFSVAAKSISLDLKVMPECLVRPLLLTRALANLLDNAIKYGGGEITVQLYGEANQLVLQVMDRGAGIPLAHRAAVKHPFFRLDAARSDVSGSGLGLAIVERVARLHHGVFELSEREGGGLQATLRLPAG